MQNPWKKLSSQEVYSNPWITVREDQVIRPDGEPGIYGVVDPKVAVGVVALSEKQEVYLVGQYRYPIDCYSWEIIEGGSEEGEDPQQTAKRELQEEAGLEANDWQKLGGQIHLSNCFTSEVGELFLAQDLTEVPTNPDPTEVLEVRKVPFQECFEMLEKGEITDALSIIALFRLKEILS